MLDSFLRDVPIFSDLDEKELMSIHSLMTEIPVEPGRILTTEGQVGLEFMILVEGTAEVTKGGELVATLGAGSFFGELAVISGRPRNATVTVTSPGLLQVLTRREFMALLDEHASIAKSILIAVLQREPSPD
jgi:CRP-like cAMP-binding protein